MGRIWMPGGGGGADLDVITAGAGDVVAPKVIVDKDGEPLAGTLSDKNDTAQAAAASLDTTNKRLQMAIPVLGRYNTGSKLYAAYSTIASLIGLTAAKLMKGQSILGIDGTATGDATAAAGDILSGKTAYVNGNKVPGSMATLAGGTYTPGTSPQTIACSGKKMTSNIVIAAIPSGVPLSFTNAGGKNDHSTYAGQNTDYDTIYPNGYAQPTTQTSLSEIKNKLANGLTLAGTAYCYDRYLASSTSYYWKNSCNFWARPVPCAKAKKITVKFRAYYKRNTANSNYSVNCNIRVCYFNDDSARFEYVSALVRADIDISDTSLHDSTQTLTVTLEDTYRAKYKWAAVCARISCSVNDYSGSILLTLYAGTGITDISYTT